MPAGRIDPRKRHNSPTAPRSNTARYHWICRDLWIGFLCDMWIGFVCDGNLYFLKSNCFWTQFCKMPVTWICISDLWLCCISRFVSEIGLRRYKSCHLVWNSFRISGKNISISLKGYYCHGALLLLLTKITSIWEFVIFIMFNIIILCFCNSVHKVDRFLHFPLVDRFFHWWIAFCIFPLEQDTCLISMHGMVGV